MTWGIFYVITAQRMGASHSDRETSIMAARLRKTHQDDVRSKIQVSNLITRLHKYANGELSDEDISPTRLNAIKLLLSKALPDLQSIEHSGKIENELSGSVEIASRPKLTKAEWLELHGLGTAKRRTE
jgi:hypothetical protein